MKSVILLLLLFSIHTFAHEHHHAGHMAANPPLSGASVWQLDSAWKDQKGDTIKLSSLAGKPRLVVMLYTKCKSACPLLVNELKEIISELKTGQTIGVSIFSLDSINETPHTLAAFAQARSLPADWQLLTTTPDKVAELAGALGIRYKRLPDGEYIHSNVIFLLDKKGEIAAQKEGLKTIDKNFIKKVKEQGRPG